MKKETDMPAKMPLRRHYDDDYYDRVIISAGDVQLEAHLVPRYKTSGLSGDEWRVSCKLTVNVAGAPMLEQGFHGIRRMFEYSPIMLYRDCAAVLSKPDAELILYRKGFELYRERFVTFGEAAIGMNWHSTIAGEQGKQRHLTDAEERGVCQQPGCHEPPRNFYRLKKLQVSRSESVMIVPEYDFVGQFTWYCPRHTTRGDCGFEDADSNLELVSGNGVPVTHAADESPSAFAGVVEIGEET